MRTLLHLHSSFWGQHPVFVRCPRDRAPKRAAPKRLVRGVAAHLSAVGGASDLAGLAADSQCIYRRKPARRVFCSGHTVLTGCKRVVRLVLSHHVARFNFPARRELSVLESAVSLIGKTSTTED